MKLSINLAAMLIMVTCVFGMCSKDDKEPVPSTPVVLQHSKGILATRGINGIGIMDTVHFRNTTSFTHPTLFSYNTIYDNNSGFYVRPRDFWQLINTGANQWHIRNNAGYYLGYKDDLNATGNDKLTMSLDQTPGPNHLFEMNRTGTNNFYIQPTANKSVFLTSLPADVQPPIPAHKKGRFISGTKQLWFLIP